MKLKDSLTCDLCFMEIDDYKPEGLRKTIVEEMVKNQDIWRKVVYFAEKVLRIKQKDDV